MDRSTKHASMVVQSNKVVITIKVPPGFGGYRGDTHPMKHFLEEELYIHGGWRCLQKSARKHLLIKVHRIINDRSWW